MLDKSDPAWPDDLGVTPPMIIVQALLDAAMTFPKETGLGWDRLHPRALCRLSHGTLLWVCAVLHNAEKGPADGRQLPSWSLSPYCLKRKGGYRAIGLLPLLPRLWMGTRKNVAAEWEASTQKPYLYAGRKMGATVAA